MRELGKLWASGWRLFKVLGTHQKIITAKFNLLDMRDTTLNIKNQL